MISENFIILGFLIQMAGSFGYFLDTLKGKIQPNRISWIFWTLAPLVVFIAQLGKGVGMEMLMTFSVVFTPFLILVASFFNRKAYWELQRFDLLCGILSIIGIALWILTKEGNLAIVFSILADLAASVPTIIKSYSHPQSESANVYFASFINAFLTLLTIRTFNFANSAFAFYIFIIAGLFVLLIKFKIGKLISKNL